MLLCYIYNDFYSLQLTVDGQTGHLGQPVTKSVAEANPTAIGLVQTHHNNTEGNVARGIVMRL